MGVTVCRRRDCAVAATLLVVVVVVVFVVVVVDYDVVVVADGVVVSPLFPATDVGMTVSSLVVFAVVSAVVL